MSYTMLNNDAIRKYDYASDSLEGAALSFIRDCCEKLRFDKNKATSMNVESIDSEREGTSLKKNQIPFNMEKDIDRLCFENAINRFLKSGKNVCPKKSNFSKIRHTINVTVNKSLERRESK